MAQFYGSMQGNRGQATRMGTKQSGLSGHVRGWNLGARVEAHEVAGQDIIEVAVTGGSNNPGTLANLGSFRLNPENDKLQVSFNGGAWVDVDTFRVAVDKALKALK
ncbi:Uncharacterised protein [uncultured archaeon]|nr:Uncharacterised protein [uncultured archaeon]